MGGPYPGQRIRFVASSELYETGSFDDLDSHHDASIFYMDEQCGGYQRRGDELGSVLAPPNTQNISRR